MVVECIAIIAIIAAIGFVYLRAQKKEYASIVATLLLVPGVHLIFELIGKRLLRVLDYGSVVWVLGDVLAMSITCLLIGRLSRYIEGRGQRRGILCVTCLYSVVLTGIFIFDLLGG